MFLGAFWLQPNLVRIARMPNTNVFGHIRVSGQFGPNSQNAEKECFWAHSGFRPIWSKPGATHPPTHPPGRHPSTRAPATYPPTRAPPTHPPTWAPPTHPPTHPGATHPPGLHPPTHPPGRHPSTRAPPTNQPTRAPPTHPGATHPPTHPGATHPPTHPGATHPPGRHPPTHPPGRHPSNSQNAENECSWARSGFSPIRSEQPECRKRMFLGTFGLQPKLVGIARMPNTNVFGHRNAECDSFWAHLGFSPTWSE